MFNRRSLYIRCTGFILSISILIFSMPLPITEVICRAEDQPQTPVLTTEKPAPQLQPQSPPQSPPQPSPAQPAAPASPLETPAEKPVSAPPAQPEIQTEPPSPAKPETPPPEQAPKQGEPGKTTVTQPQETATPPGTEPPQLPALPAQPGMPGAVQPPPLPAPPQAAPALPRRGQFTLNFDDADIYMIIQTIFGEILKVNYVVDPRVKGRVTFRSVSPVPMESILPLMEVVLRLNGIGIVEESGLYRIVPIGDIAKEPSPVSYGRDPSKIPITGRSILQVVPITYVQSSEVLKLITPFASTNAVLIDVPKGNQIIIVDTDASVKRLLKLIEVFDNEKLKQRKPRVFVYPVQNSKAKDIASLLQQIFLGKAAGAERLPAKAGAGPQAMPTPPQVTPGAAQPPISQISSGSEMIISDFTKIIPDDITNSIIVLSTPEEYAVIKEAIEKIDIVPRQVVIEGIIASVSLTDNLSLGIAAMAKGNIFNLDSRISLNPGALIVDPTKLSNTGFTFVGTDGAGVVRALITALATESKAKLLATPHILVADNRDAKIQVGQQVPIITSETYGTPGVAPQRNIQYRDIGIILKVRPQVNDSGLVSLEIYQEVSTFETILLFADEKQIILNKTDASTNLVVQDKQTIVIGGLIREDTTKSRSGIPFLSRIPIIGWLFGTTDDNTTRQEIIILLTPHVIKNQKEAKDISSEFLDKISESSKGKIKKEEIIRKRPDKQSNGRPAEIQEDKLPKSPQKQENFKQPETPADESGKLP